MPAARPILAAAVASSMIGAVFETAATGGLVTMGAAALGTALAVLGARRVAERRRLAPTEPMAEMAAATVGGSLGALAAVTAAVLTGHAVGSMAAMLWMAGSMGAMIGVSVVHTLVSGHGLT